VTGLDISARVLMPMQTAHRNDPRYSNPSISPPTHGRLLRRSFTAQRPYDDAGGSSTGSNYVLSLQIGPAYEIWHSYYDTSFAAGLAQPRPDLDSVDLLAVSVCHARRRVVMNDL
jgi:hypothetical protein